MAGVICYGWCSASGGSADEGRCLADLSGFLLGEAEDGGISRWSGAGGFINILLEAGGGSDRESPEWAGGLCWQQQLLLFVF